MSLPEDRRPHLPFGIFRLPVTKVDQALPDANLPHRSPASTEATAGPQFSD